MVESAVSRTDLAYKYAVEDPEIEIDEEFERKLVRKIDCYIMPIMSILMSIQLMDKSTNSYASIMGLQTDLNMSSSEYSWVASSFYLGFLIFEFPANMALQRFPLSKTLAAAILAWGVVICCHGACHSAASFLACRTLLGIFESFMTPAYILLTSQWYKKSEQYVRCGVWLGFEGFGTMLGSGIAYGLYKHGGSNAIASWRLLYIITGVITIFFAVVSYLHIPDVPVKAWFLNEKEKVYVVERIRINNQGFGNHYFKMYQFKEALMDPNTYLFLFYMIGYGIPNGGIGNFGSILLKDNFGFSTGNALLMNMVGSGIDIVFPLLFAFIQQKFVPSRLAMCLFINSCMFTGLCLLAFSSPKGAQMVGYYLSYFSTASYATMASCISTNVAGYTKKITLNSVFLIGFCAGNMIGPQTFLGSESEDNYPTAKKVMVSTFTLCLIAPSLMLTIISLRNKKKAKKIAELGDSYQKIPNSEFADLTDMENLEFKYSY
ncbi:hypothetical protein PACTADRAFT_84619 [Pachysolen tannophilus NRRL Y-2460]|uniref:Major facilitator superfamily (MFS) profile domain-containing protein n=1 Tax=Pachysolen tannophilus NRRL Y-2460 TaxID=669874 RepID=A0A1E4U0L7_PACTA|nr:hypothetical protein PACTADRAFT_84619 [Pachysolen tannophilus NRRL Y-2460]